MTTLSQRQIVRLLSPMLLCLTAVCGREVGQSDLPRAGETNQGKVASGASQRPPAPSCGSSSTTVCFHDTAYVHVIDTDPGTQVDAHWLFFGAGQDSLEFFGSAGGNDVDGTALSTDFGTTFGFQERDQLRNTAPYNRFRLPSDGVVTLWVVVDDDLGDTVPYTLRHQRLGSATARALQATGRSATLTLLSQKVTDRISVIPLAIPRIGLDRSKWTVFPRRYRVALSADSLYEVCKIPCSRPDTLKLTPSAHVSKRF